MDRNLGGGWTVCPHPLPSLPSSHHLAHPTPAPPLPTPPLPSRFLFLVPSRTEGGPREAWGWDPPFRLLRPRHSRWSSRDRPQGRGQDAGRRGERWRVCEAGSERILVGGVEPTTVVVVTVVAAVSPPTPAPWSTRAQVRPGLLPFPALHPSAPTGLSSLRWLPLPRSS